MLQPADPAIRRLAEEVRNACIRAAITSYERAAYDGLCAEGAWECAVDAMRQLDVTELLGKQLPNRDD
jgi:hypothetical protein